jgi:hypothetical protein
MANELYIYTTPRECTVTLLLDDGRLVTGTPPMTANGRNDAHLLQIPVDVTATQGSTLTTSHPGMLTDTHRGVLVPSRTGPAQFLLDDVHLMNQPVVPPQPNPSNDPRAIIDRVYATGSFDLATHDGCGQFTEACGAALHDRHSPQWGHIKKNPGQNQYNGHAVDALYLRGGVGETEAGVYDIIHDSVSPNASPSFNWSDPGNPSLWYYPA